MSNLTAPLFSLDGKSAGEVSLDDAIFGIEPNVGVMHQVVNAQLGAARRGTHSTKTRAEVRGGGRKPWRQKGLGRARHGSIRSPIWSGGGVAHGPKPRSYRERTPKKMKRLALYSALSARQGEGEVKVVQDLGWAEPKTATAKALLGKLGCEGKVLVVLETDDGNAIKSLRNLTNVTLNDAGQLNTYDVLWSDTVVFTQSALDSLSRPATFDVEVDDFVKEGSASDEPAEGGEEE